MRKIKLSNGLITLVDDEDYEELSKYRWHGGGGRNEYTCPVRWEKGKSVYMHRQIMKCPKGMVVDHIDHNRLNNTKSNLRICTVSQNTQNKKDNGKFQGVHWDNTHKKYRSRIRVNGERKHLGYFDDLNVAALHYNEAAKQYYGEQAKLNKVAA